MNMYEKRDNYVLNCDSYKNNIEKKIRQLITFVGFPEEPGSILGTHGRHFTIIYTSSYTGSDVSGLLGYLYLCGHGHLLIHIHN